MSKLSYNQELKMIKRGNHEEIMAYIAKRISSCKSDNLAGRIFSCKAQVDLIERGNHEEIMACIEEAYIEGKAQVALVKRGNNKEILTYIGRYLYFDEDAEWQFRDAGEQGLHRYGEGTELQGQYASQDRGQGDAALADTSLHDRTPDE